MKSTRRPFHALPALCLLAVVGACEVTGTSGPIALEPIEVTPQSGARSLFGAWLAYTIEVSSLTDGAVSRDLVPSGGIFSLRVDPDATYTRLTSLTGGALTRHKGTLVITESTLTLVPDNGFEPTVVYTYRLSGEVLKLDFEGTFDVDRDGVEEGVVFHTELIENPISLGNR